MDALLGKPSIYLMNVEEDSTAAANLYMRDEPTMTHLPHRAFRAAYVLGKLSSIEVPRC
jgi:hypothetical protein